jgi:ATP-binding cassette subfamily B protein
MNFFDTRKTGEIISRFNDAGKIREAISGVTLTLMIDVVMVLVCGVVLWQRSRELFLVAVIIFLLYLLTSLLYVKPLDKFNRDLMEQNAQFSSYLKESIDGIETVKSTQAENAVKEKTHTLFLTFLNRNITGSLLSLSKDSIIECITSVGTLVLLWVGAVNILNGEMTIGSLVTFLTLLNYFLDPIQNLVELQSTLQTALVAADRLNDVLALSTEQSGEEIPQNGLESISFDNVTFRYGNREQVLTGLTFSAKKGEQIALVGESGCGKSTATKLLMGFYPPESGTVKIGNTPIQALSLRWLRNQTAYVPQNTFLFCDTVKNNLLLGLDKDHMPTDKELEQVLDACGCEFIKKMPLGLDSMLEENGSNLSGGQRQRLAIARALLRKPKLLILDEATSALDTITEYRIQNALRELCPEMIVVMVAHRLSTVKHCSQILVMNHGAITERGTHEELLSKNHSYAQLWNRQNAA